MSLIAIDIETAPAPGWETYERAALDFNRNRITLVAVYDGAAGKVFRSIDDLNQYLATLDRNARFVFHNGKFDLKSLMKHGASLTFDDLHQDTNLMAVADPHKIPDSWLVRYEMRRKEENTRLGAKVHRSARHHSLKTLAPYHLNVAPFWEVADHNDEEYAGKDARYTWELYSVLRERLTKSDALDFYENKLLPWARMLARAEYTGVTIDNDLMTQMEVQSQIKMAEAERKLDELWADAHKTYYDMQVKELQADYQAKTEAAITRLKDKAKAPVTAVRYNGLMQKAIAKVPPKINLASPAQLTWLMRDYLGLDISTFNGEDESTGKPVLKRIAGTREDVRTFLQFREHHKLIHAFFPSYRQMQMRSVVHGTFNPDVARTGRLSSSDPNLQQVPGALHALFRARPGHRFAIFDLSAIEPTVIAFLTEDPILCNLLVNGGNFHSNNVRVFLGIDASDAEIKAHMANERAMVKEVALALMYGAGSERIRESAQKFGFTWSQAFCRDVHRRFKDTYETVFKFKRDLDRHLETGGTMKNVLGRVLRIERKADVYMTGFNTLVQSSASDMLLESARKAEDDVGTEVARPLLFVHDEAIFEPRENQAVLVADRLRHHMEAWKLPTSFGLIPVKAEGGVRDYWQKG